MEIRKLYVEGAELNSDRLTKEADMTWATPSPVLWPLFYDDHKLITQDAVEKLLPVHHRQLAYAWHYLLLN